MSALPIDRHDRRVPDPEVWEAPERLTDRDWRDVQDGPAVRTAWISEDEEDDR